MASHKPRRLKGRGLEKIWGSTHLEPWFPNATEKTGEIWFDEKESPLLIKFLFTTENLSVQVHPNDEQARAAGGMRGKTEMWHILRAEPDARIALGLNHPATAAQLREACLNGSIMEMLRWIPVRAGDQWFVPAGAIHAIGAGIALCEIQQHSDITYRLYDYNRDRELHLDQGLQVADVTFIPSPEQLADSPYFQVQPLTLAPGSVGSLAAGPSSFLVATRGEGRIAAQPFHPGEVWLLPAGQPTELSGEAQLLHVTSR